MARAIPEGRRLAAPSRCLTSVDRSSAFLWIFILRDSFRDINSLTKRHTGPPTSSSAFSVAMRHLPLVASRPPPCIIALRCSPAVALHTPPERPRSPTQHLVVVGRRVSRAAKSTANAVVTLVLALLLFLPFPSPSFAMTVDMTAPPVVTTDVGLPGGAMRRRYGMPALPVTVPRRKTSFVTAAVEAVGPSVVRIDTERLVERVPLEGYLFPGLEPEGQRKESGQGSGVILSEEGILMRLTLTLTTNPNPGL